jgi:hypothetical protein
MEEFSGPMVFPNMSPTNEETPKKANQISNAISDSTGRTAPITAAAAIQVTKKIPVNASPAHGNRARRKISPTTLSKDVVDVLSRRNTFIQEPFRYGTRTPVLDEWNNSSRDSFVRPSAP